MENLREKQVEVGRRIAAAIEDANMSQDSVASALGVSQATVSRWTLGSSVPEWKHIAPLGRLVNVPPAKLLEPLLDVEVSMPRPTPAQVAVEIRRTAERLEELLRSTGDTRQ